MHVHFHIGHHKTGTTSLQAFLALNAPLLIRRGILYPWVESQGAALAVANAGSRARFMGRTAMAAINRKLGRDQTGSRRDVLPINVREAHNALAFRMLADQVDHWQVPSYHKELPHSAQMLIGLRNQLTYLQPDHVVFCSEVMSHFGIAAPDQIGRLMQAVGGDARTLWCTLRRPDEQAVSWHGQLIRFGQAPLPLSHPDGLNLDWLHFDYQRTLQPWIDQMPGCKVMLRPYRETLAAGGSVEDFVQNSGIRFPRALLPAPKLNVSLPPAVLVLMRRANHDLPQPLRREFGNRLMRLSDGLKLASSREVEMIGAENRRRMFDAFQPIHAYLNGLSGRTAFFDDLDGMLDTKPMTEELAVRQFFDLLPQSALSRVDNPELQGYLSEQRRAALAG